jgi:hypothetical protein
LQVTVDYVVSGRFTSGQLGLSIVWWGTSGRGSFFTPKLFSTTDKIVLSEYERRHNTICFPIQAKPSIMGKYLSELDHLALNVFYFTEKETEASELKKAASRMSWKNRRTEGKNRFAFAPVPLETIAKPLLTVRVLFFSLFLFVDVFARCLQLNSAGFIRLLGVCC